MFLLSKNGKSIRHNNTRPNSKFPNKIISFLYQSCSSNDLNVLDLDILILYNRELASKNIDDFTQVEKDFVLIIFILY